MKKLISLVLMAALALAPYPVSSQGVREVIGMAANTETAQAIYFPTCAATVGSGLTNVRKLVSDTVQNRVWFVTNEATPNIRSIDPSTNMLDAAIADAAGATLFSVAFSSSENRVYATGRTAGGLNKVVEVNPVTEAIGTTTTSATNLQWTDSLYVSANDRVWITADGATDIVFINPSTIAIAGTTDVSPEQPVQLALATSVSKIYASSFNTGEVTVLNASTGAVVTTITLTGTAPAGIVYVPSTDRIWVANGNNDTIDIINPNTDTITNTISSSIDFGTNLSELAYFPPADEVILTAGSASVSAIGVFSASLESQLGTSTLPQTTHRGMAYHEDNQTLYIGMASAVCAVN